METIHVYERTFSEVGEPDYFIGNISDLMPLSAMRGDIK